jgi:hypothetical protein
MLSKMPGYNATAAGKARSSGGEIKRILMSLGQCVFCVRVNEVMFALGSPHVLKRRPGISKGNT